MKSGGGVFSPWCVFLINISGTVRDLVLKLCQFFEKYEGNIVKSKWEV